ncbi:MAG TPA: CHASE domain-containing protein [Vicinamibacterales bacterium]|nr:CHASE domain-containing protein [Vicinamibacterales bacterium]
MSKERPFTTLRRRLLHRSVPYGLFAAACGLSIAASSYLSWNSAMTGELQDRAEFLTDARQIHRQLQTGLNSYLEVVRAGAVLLSADNEIHGREFRRFVNGLELPERYPAMDGIGFAPCIRRADLARVLGRFALDGNRIRLWPRTNDPESCPIAFLEPALSRNRRALGFDLASEPQLLDAMVRARDSGQPQLSRKLGELAAWDSGLRPNLVVFIPVYRHSSRQRSFEEIRRAFVGFVFSPLHSHRLFEDIVELTVPSLGFEIYDEGGVNAGDSLGGLPGSGTSARYQTAETVQMAGREWLYEARMGGDVAAIVPRAAAQTFAGGFILSFLLFVITRAQVRAWETAARHEAALRASAEALQEREAQANAANRAKDEFLATLSHELRTPLNVVLGWVGMLRQQAMTPDRTARALEIIERNARQQAALIDDLLDVSRIITGKLHLDLRPLDLAAIVSAVAESLRPSAEAKGVWLQLIAAERATVKGDPDRLRQTVWNLLSNALKFTPAGGSVVVELTRDERQVRLMVRDTGVGISPEFLPRVFDRFQQADSSTTRAHSGVGLGLAIVRELVELHGGTVGAHSAGVGFGAVFTVSLPAASGAALPATSALSTEQPSQQLHGVRVLVVDDDPNTLEMLTEALQTSGAEVTAADSARHALARLAESRADVIISDIAMPGEDGLWLMHHVRTLPGRLGSTPAVALTALAHSEDRRRAIKAGFQIHMTKPVRLADLQTVVGELAIRHADGGADDVSA